MKYILLTLIAFILLSTNLKAEALSGQARIDSLLTELPKAKGDTNHVNLLNNLSYTIIYDNPDKGIKYAKQALVLAKKIDWKKGEADSYNNLAINNAVKSDYSKTLEYSEIALNIFEELSYKSGVATSLFYIGSAYQMQLDFPKALEYFSEAIKINEEIGDRKGIAINLGEIGAIYLYQSNYPKALEYLLKAVKRLEEIGNKDLMASILGSIGNIYMAQSNYPKSLEYYQKGIKIFEELGNKFGVANYIGNIGGVYHSQLNYSKALEYYKKSLKTSEELGNKSGVANILINIGELYTDINELDKSLDYLKRGLVLNEEVGDTRLITHTLNMLAGNYIARAVQIDSLQSRGETSPVTTLIKKEQIYRKALEFGLRAEKLADSIGLRELKHHIYKQVSTAYEGLGTLDKALEYHKKFQIEKDSVFSEEKNKQIASLEKAREDDVNRIQIEKQKVQLEAQESEKMFIIYSGIGIIAFVIAILALIAYQRKKSDKLLYNVLPISIAKRLKKKEHPISDHFEQASIIFIDIVGFTAMSKDSDPTDIVKALNKVFTHYDSIASKHGLEKIKTIGDCYMAAAGIPVIQKDNTLRAARMAIEVRDYMVDYYTDHGFKLDVRIGLDCGPVVAGVIGDNKFIYDMWSDAVNTASRMESTGQSGSVQISERFKEAVFEFDEFEFEARGEMEIKGKGKMKTFFMGSRIPTSL